MAGNSKDSKILENIKSRQAQACRSGDLAQTTATSRIVGYAYTKSESIRCGAAALL